jgi:WD40 repeat protein
MERPLATADGRWLFAGTWHGEPARVIDAASGRAVLTFARESVRGSFSADGRLLAVGVPGLFRIFRVGEWRDPVTLEGASGEIPLAGASAFSPDGTMVAVSLPPHEIRLVNAASGATLARLPNPERFGITALRFSPDGHRLAITTLERTLIVWDLQGLRRALGELGLDW